ncbi:hypothetical protein DAEQUDRAFT_95193, partial [Daedalea quercina L-15889]
HTYLDGTFPFTFRERWPWGPLIARRPCPQGDPAVCMGFGSCTVSIFSCPASALGLGGPFFLSLGPPNPNPMHSQSAALVMTSFCAVVALVCGLEYISPSQ